MLLLSLHDLSFLFRNRGTVRNATLASPISLYAVWRRNQPPTADIFPSFQAWETFRVGTACEYNISPFSFETFFRSFFFLRNIPHSILKTKPRDGESFWLTVRGRSIRSSNPISSLFCCPYPSTICPRQTTATFEKSRTSSRPLSFVPFSLPFSLSLLGFSSCI